MNRKLTILIAEDDENEALLLKLAFRKAKINNPIQFVIDGEEAVRYLNGVERFANRQQFPFPSVIMLDLKMPRLTGFEVLAWMRKNPNHAITPSIVFTNSRRPEDIQRAYALGANAYIVKPADLTALVKILQTSYDYWSVCEKPALAFAR